jgi:thiol-disulfide isomerase/thioredoxin
MVIIKASSGPSRAPAIATSRLGGGGGGGISDPGTTPLAPGVLTELSSVAPTTFAAVGSPASVTPPTSVGHKGPILRDATGKPVITYIGAEYCPYCAAERWALAVALSRFGTFSNLSGTHSSSTDIYPNTQTLSFYGSGYSSPYVSFDSVESATNKQVNGTYPTLQTPTAQQSTLLSSYDPSGNIPFLDIGNKYLITGASYSPQLLQGLSGSQIASKLNNPSSAVAQAIDGTANNITAAICAVTGNTPSSVASSPTIAAIEKSLGA